MASGSRDGIRLWDAVTGAHKATLTGHTGDVQSVAFSPDGLTVASGSRDQTVRLWDAVTGAHKATLTGHTFWLNSVAFSPDGLTVASGSDAQYGAFMGRSDRCAQSHADRAYGECLIV